MHWWDKQENEISQFLNCKVGGYGQKEIQENYDDGFCMREEDGRELTLDEAKEWYKGRQATETNE
ncbi:hypothetical protein Q9R46_14675 [Paenibacillus sp. RRE4]|uniref:hypothetical protein n=1 Tax=Paenibacillus sp. RRE4 TaxID=2962587 RepID=UPI00288210EC|nr:hypothetical protein [Paenibacillus sp. RRE4]MDT0123903.1 hypothetical protein [Paenibacillus sp. RRE4]